MPWIPYGGETFGSYWLDEEPVAAKPDTGMDLSSVFGAYNIPINIGNSDAQTLYRAVAVENMRGNNNAVNTLAQIFGVDPASVMSDTSLWNSPAMQNYAAQRVEIGNQENMLGDLLQGAAWVGGGALGINALFNSAGVSGMFNELAGNAATPAVTTPYSATSFPVDMSTVTGTNLPALTDAGYLNTLGEWGSMAAPATATEVVLTPAATTAGVNAAVPSIVSAPATGGLTLADLAPTAAGTATAGGVSPAIATAAGVPSVTGATAGLMGLDPAIAAAAGVPSVAGGLATGTSVLAGAAPGAALTTAQLAGVTVPDVVPAAATAAAKAATAAAKDDGLTDTGSIMPYVTSAGLNLAGGLLSADAASEAAQKQAETQLKIADMMRFRPVGVTTRFGSSNFGYDPATGNLTSAGYTLSPETKALQDSLMGAAPGLLSQFTGAQAATAPMGKAAQAAMNLGNQYLTTSPQAQAQKYMDEQMALIQPQNERALAALEAKLQAQGRLGLATGGTSTLGASNPELEALYNAQKMQQLQLAAAATQGGMDYAKFGTGLVGAGGDLLNSMYGTQVAAFNPYNTALTGANTLEGMGQQAMNIGTTLGAQQTTANTPAANLMGQAAATQAAGNAVSPWGALLSGAGNAIQNYQTQQQQAATAQQQYQGLLSAITNGLSNWKP